MSIAKIKQLERLLLFCYNIQLTGDDIMQWSFNLPVQLEFGCGKRKNLKEYITALGGTRGVLVCSKTLEKNGSAKELCDLSEGRIVP